MSLILIAESSWNVTYKPLHLGNAGYVRPRVSGRAYLTGFHQFVLEQDDPLPAGFRIGPKPRDVPAPTA